MHALRIALAAATVAVIASAAVSATPSTLTLHLYAQNRPGETGTATFEEISGGVKVVVKMPGGQNGTQPIHIHTGTCARLSLAPKYHLNNIVHGSSTTTIPSVSLGDLLEGGYVIDVHESSANMTRYVACAAI